MASHSSVTHARRHARVHLLFFFSMQRSGDAPPSSTSTQHQHLETEQLDPPREEDALRPVRLSGNNEIDSLTV